MSHYKRTPLRFKKVSLQKGVVPASKIKPHQKKIQSATKEAQSLIAQVLMTNLNPAQKQALDKAKNLLND